MVIITPSDDLASHPLTVTGNATGGHDSQPPASSPALPFFDHHGTAAAGYIASTTSESSQPPPYAPAPATSGGEFNFNTSSSPPMFSGYTMDAFFAPPAMAETSHYYWYPPCAAPVPFAQDAMPPPVLVPMQITRAEPFFNPSSTQSQGAATSSAAIVHALADTEKPQETTTPAPRRRGRPRKNAADAKPVFKPKRATVRGSRAALQQAASATAIVGQVQVPLPLLDQQTTSDVENQVQEPDQEASFVALLATTSNHTAPCTNPMALRCQEQWPLQPTFSNSLSAGGQASAVIGQEAMLQYADTSAEGVRFQPTDEELIFYLRLKHAGREMPVDFFKEFDVYQAYPETSRAVCGVVNGFWYAFSPRDRKYKNGVRPARSVVEASGRQLGYWKSNTKLASVNSRGADGALIGTVTSLTFHLGRQPHGTQTPWKMKEYAIPENQHAPDGSAMRLNDWVVCKLFYRERVITARQDEGQLGEGAEDDSGAGGDEGAQMVSSADQTPQDSEQDLCVEDYNL